MSTHTLHWVPLELHELALREGSAPVPGASFRCPRCDHVTPVPPGDRQPNRLTCAGCGGTRVMGEAAAYLVTRLLIRHGVDQPTPLRRSSRGAALRCHGCATFMVRTRVRGVHLDRCGTCGMVWFDRGELERFTPRPREAPWCPRCTPPCRLVLEKGPLQSDVCGRCGGVLLDSAGTVQVLCDELGHTVAGLKQRAVDRPMRRLRCPPCGASMLHVALDGVAVDVCARCGASWLDREELAAVSGGRHA